MISINKFEETKWVKCNCCDKLSKGELRLGSTKIPLCNDCLDELKEEARDMD
jgi:hypothetical protein